MRLDHRQRFQLVLPSEDHRVFIHFAEVHLDASLEFFFGRHPYTAEQGLGHLPKERLDQVQPGAVRGGEDEFEPVRHRGQIGSRLPGKMGGVIIENHANARRSGVVGVRSTLGLLVRRVAAIPETVSSVW